MSLSIDVPEAARVTIRIYDRTGRLIRTLVNETVSPGQYAFRWDGRADAGGPPGPGVYYAVMKAPGFSDRTKLIVVR